MKALTSTGKLSTEDPELANRFDRVLTETVEAMEEVGIRYAFIGGIASGGLGRPRSTHDIDLFVVPEEAEIALRALAKRGFRTEKTDPSWLYKGFKENILVDIIFKSKGEIYLDSEMVQRLITAEFHGKRLRLVAPEDLLIIKAAAHSELTPNHWHDAIALLSHASLDWDYLIKRARRAPRRILSLLLYAQSNDIGVPNHVIHALYSGLFGNNGAHGASLTSWHRDAPYREETVKRLPEKNPTAALLQPVKPVHNLHHAYAVAHLRNHLAKDGRVAELDIQIEQHGNRILLRGDVCEIERKHAVEKIAKEFLPELIFENQIRVLSIEDPKEVEDMP